MILRYFNGTNTQLAHTANTGAILLQASPSESSIRCNASDSVELYYDNNKKFETTSTGAKVTGVATVSNGIVETAATISTNHSITSNFNAMSAGPVTVSATITIPSGSVWTIV